MCDSVTVMYITHVGSVCVEVEWFYVKNIYLTARFLHICAVTYWTPRIARKGSVSTNNFLYLPNEGNVAHEKL